MAFTEPAFDNARLLDGSLQARYEKETADLRSILAQAARANFILHYRDVSQFVVGFTKTQKKDYVSAIVGLGKLAELRDDLQAVYKDIERNPRFYDLGGRISQQKDNLFTLCGLTCYSRENVLAHCRRIAKECSAITALTSLDDLEPLIQELDGRRVRLKGSKKLDGLNELKGDLALVSEAFTFVGSLKRIVADYNGLIKRREFLAAGLYQELYDSAEELIKGGHSTKDTCPLCELEKQHGELVELIRLRREEIGTVSREVKRVERDFSTSLVTGRKHQDRAVQITHAIDKYVPDTDSFKKVKERVQDIGRLVSLIEVYKNDKTIEIDFPRFESFEASFNRDLPLCIEELQNEIDKEAIDPSLKNFFEKKASLKRVSELLDNLSELESHKKAYDVISPSMEEVFEQFDEMQKRTLTSFLTQLSSLTDSIYSKIHPGEGIKNVALRALERIGIEFGLEFYGESISPPTKVLSESHLNTLGIALFLASIKELNGDIAFVVLDDIVTSLDSNHRARLAKILAEDFKEYQFLVLTHDDLWFQTLAHLPEARDWMFLKIKTWNYNSGIVIERKSRDIEEEIRQRLAEGDHKPIFNLLRQWIEELLWDISVRLCVPIPAKRNDKNAQRPYQNLAKYLSHHLKSRSFVPSNVRQAALADLDFAGWLADMESHFNRFESSKPGKGEIQEMIRRIEEFRFLFMCSDCKKDVWYKELTKPTTCIQCRCGKMTLEIDN